LAQALAGEGITAIYTSPQRRAMQTADPTAKALGLEPVRCDGLAEFDYGAEEYVFFDALKEANDPRYRACLAGDLSAWGTTREEFCARATAAVERIAERHPGERVLLVSHGGVVNSVLGAVLGLDRLWFFRPENTGISRIGVNAKGKMRITTVNEFSHLR
jgi:probable phosphoglycerate mutase